jgi:hypothetical protein
VFLLYHRLFEPFKALFSSFSSFKVLLLFVMLAMLFFPVNIAHCFELSFAWDANTEPDLAGYRVFYRQEGQNYDYNNPAWKGTETTCTINGLDNNTTYYFVSRAYDTNGNASENSVELCYEPEISNPAVTTSSGGGGGGCFIATAAYGSQFEPHVTLLRQFRDRFLLPHAAGRTFVRLYYAYSPPLADFISGHERLRMIVRWSLLPLVGLSWSLLRLGFLPTTLFLLLILSMIPVGRFFSRSKSHYSC